MLPHPRFSAVVGTLCGAVALLLGGTGCETKPPDETARAIYYGEKPVAMRGSDTFFNGQVAAIVTISRGIGRGYSHPGTGKSTGRKAYAVATGPDGVEQEQDQKTKERLSTLPGNPENMGQIANQSVPTANPQMGGTVGGMGANQTNSMGMGAPVGLAQGQMPGQNSGGIPGEGGPAEDYGQGTEQDADAARMEQENAMAYLRAKAAIGSPLPPVTLHLNLRNLNAQPVVVEVATFDSELGNFAVEPSAMNLPPHELRQPEPMISQLGVTSDVIPVKVTLKMNGQTETKTVFVRSLLDPTDTGGN